MKETAPRTGKREDDRHHKKEKDPAGHRDPRPQVAAQLPQPNENQWKKEDATLGCKGIARVRAQRHQAVFDSCVPTCVEKAFRRQFIGRVDKGLVVSLEPEQAPAAGRHEGVKEIEVADVPPAHNDEITSESKQTGRNHAPQPIRNYSLGVIDIRSCFPYDGKTGQSQPEQAVAAGEGQQTGQGTEGDGNPFFRAGSQQEEGSPEQHVQGIVIRHRHEGRVVEGKDREQT